MSLPQPGQRPHVRVKLALNLNLVYNSSLVSDTCPQRVMSSRDRTLTNIVVCDLSTKHFPFVGGETNFFYRSISVDGEIFFL